MSAVDGSPRLVDLTADSEGDTEHVELQGTDVDMIDDNASDSIVDSSSPAPLRSRPKPTTSRPGITKKAIPRANAKRSTKKTPGSFSQWRSGQSFEDIEAEDSPTAKREKRKLEREAEEKEMGKRIQELAATVGWKQPNRTDQRTTKKNSTAVPYRYKEERLTLCAMCDDKVPVSESTKLRCKHRHCNSCLQRNFEMVINQPNMWPAKCCGPLDQDLAYGVLTKEEFERFLDVKRSKEQMSTSSCYNCQKQLLSVNIVGGGSGFCMAYATKMEEYRERSKKGEEALLVARNAMADQNSKALEKQQVVSEILTLRAKLDKRSPRKTPRKSSPKAKPPPTPTSTTSVEPPTPAGIEDIKQKYPALMKVLEDDKPEEPPAKVPSLMDKFRTSFPALMKEFDEKAPRAVEEDPGDWPMPDVKDDGLFNFDLFLQSSDITGEMGFGLRL
ncbi:hypothetical protein Dda_1075 [Drechslerella dactyloides]|uniref:RING-type domain-containing protein n=1 Tax=Drechslerella dactyloides TaxID=74499 RepID=A0AAD6NNL8_DREDA|nr:hypothetical protein Dda_1075 [Drechslerella dactyloides]